MSLHSTLIADAATVRFEVQADPAKVEYRDQQGDDWGTAIGAIVPELRDGTEFVGADRRSKVQRRTIQVLIDPDNATWGGLATVRQGGEFRIDADDNDIWAVAPERGSIQTTGAVHEIDLVRSSPRDGGMPGRQIRVR